jgi:general stress protein 26
VEHEPNTTVDERFSDPGTSATTWGDTRRALETAQLFWIVTVRPDGRPHLTPLVAVWLDDALHFCTGDTEQKAVNLRSNNRVLLLTGSNAWEQGLDVVVEGAAIPVTDEDDLARLATEWATKWDGQWKFEVRDGRFHQDAGSALVFRVDPTKVLAFGKGPFSQTRHDV